MSELTSGFGAESSKPLGAMNSSTMTSAMDAITAAVPAIFLIISTHFPDRNVRVNELNQADRLNVDFCRRIWSAHLPRSRRGQQQKFRDCSRKNSSLLREISCAGRHPLRARYPNLRRPQTFLGWLRSPQRCPSVGPKSYCCAQLGGDFPQPRSAEPRLPLPVPRCKRCRCHRNDGARNTCRTAKPASSKTTRCRERRSSGLHSDLVRETGHC